MQELVNQGVSLSLFLPIVGEKAQWKQFGLREYI